MKKIILPIFLMLITSCAVPGYYQVFKTNSENGVVKENNVVFEDASCIVYYNLWADGGDIGFSIYNKTNNDITINLTKSYFVKNGVAYEYFQNRIFSKSSNSGTTLISNNYPHYWNNNALRIAGSISTSLSTSYVEKPELTIPSKTLINISEYIITNSRFIDCDLPRNPTSKKIKTLKYSKESSPFVFYNLITYNTKDDTIKITNSFYVSEISNLPLSEMFISVDTTTCGSKLNVPIKVLKNSSPDKFYINYK